MKWGHTAFMLQREKEKTTTSLSPNQSMPCPGILESCNGSVVLTTENCNPQIFGADRKGNVFYHFVLKTRIQITMVVLFGWLRSKDWQIWWCIIVPIMCGAMKSNLPVTLEVEALNDTFSLFWELPQSRIFTYTVLLDISHSLSMQF